MLNNRLLAAVALVAAAFLFFSCQKEEKVRPPIVDEPAPDIAVTAPEAPLPKWLPSDAAHIAIVFGCGYETEELRQPVIDFINDEYGLAENGGLIETYLFPDEYLNGQRIRVAFLTNLLKNKNLSGVILLGAPDRTYFALSDLVESGFSSPVWSIFPVIYTSDEILGTENSSFFVLSYQVEEREQADADSSLMKKMTSGEEAFPGEISDVLRPVIQYIRKTSESVDEPFSPSVAAAYLLKSYSSVFPDCTVSRYVEQLSGIAAQNHYVLGVKK